MSDENKPNAPKVQRWTEVGTTLVCHCGERIAYLDHLNEDDLERHRIGRYHQTPRSNRPNSFQYNNDTTIVREDLRHLQPSESYEVMLKTAYETGTYQELYRSLRSGYQLCTRLRFCATKHQNTLTVASRVLYEASQKGAEEIRGRCLKCNRRHDLTMEYREDLLLRWIEEIEARKAPKRT